MHLPCEPNPLNIRILLQEIIQQIHNDLTVNYQHPPTIKELAKIHYISEQKLTAGFKYLYHCSIHDYISNLRLDVTNTNF